MLCHAAQAHSTGAAKSRASDAVEHAPVAREDGARVFDACAALNERFDQVSQLSGDVQNN